MDPNAPTMNEILVVATLALVSGAIWHWSGWLGWPTGPERKPLGRMVPLDGLGGFVVYLVAQIGVGAALGMYRAIRHSLEHPGSKAAPSLMVITPVEMLVILVVSSIPLLAYYGIRCIPRAGEPDRQTGLEVKGFGRLALLGVLAGVTVIPFVMLMSLVVQELGLRVFDAQRPTEGHQMLKMLQDSPTAVNYLVVTLSAVVMAPLVEELLFRGILQGSLRPFGRGTAVGVSAVIFALVHLGSVPWQVLPALALLGVALSVMFEKTGVVWPGIIAHATFNALNLVLSIWFVVPGEK